MKVVINSCYGGFGLSEAGHALYLKKKGNHIYTRDLDREDPILVEVVEELGEASSSSLAKLKVVEVPEGIEYTIEEYDGLEHIAEVHRTWN
jgi:hypothetical protein